MKILAEVDKNRGIYMLIRLTDKLSHGRISGLILQGSYPRAILEAVSAGEALKEVSEAEKYGIEVDLILTEDGAHWDHTVRR